MSPYRMSFKLEVKLKLGRLTTVVRYSLVVRAVVGMGNDWWRCLLKDWSGANKNAICNFWPSWRVRLREFTCMIWYPVPKIGDHPTHRIRCSRKLESARKINNGSPIQCRWLKPRNIHEEVSFQRKPLNFSGYNMSMNSSYCQLTKSNKALCDGGKTRFI